MRLQETIAGILLFGWLFGCDADFVRENPKQNSEIINLPTLPELIFKQKTQSELCADYGKQLDCLYQFGVPFYDMNTSLGKLCDYCGERFSSCMLAYQSDCDGVFPEGYECSGQANCILKCFDEGFCEVEGTYGILSYTYN